MSISSASTSTTKPQSKPLCFSIVIPSFNHARFLAQALDSVFSQSYSSLQVIVADGASTDGTQSLLRDYAAKHPELEWLSEPDNGPADAVNKGLNRVTGDIVGILSSDDFYCENAFLEVSSVFRNNADIGIVYGNIDSHDEQGNYEYTRHMPDFSWEAFFGISLAIPQGSVFFRRELGVETGLWNPAYYSCDIDYWLRMFFRGDSQRIPRSLSGWRRYAGQRTTAQTAKKIWDGYWAMIQDSKDIATASPHIRRLAFASRHILAMRYPPYHSRLVVWWHLFLATVAHPGFWRYNTPDVYLRWIPGYRWWGKIIW